MKKKSYSSKQIATIPAGSFKKILQPINFIFEFEESPVYAVNDLAIHIPFTIIRVRYEANEKVKDLALTIEQRALAESIKAIDEAIENGIVNLYHQVFHVLFSVDKNRTRHLTLQSDKTHEFLMDESLPFHCGREDYTVLEFASALPEKIIKAHLRGIPPNTHLKKTEELIPLILTLPPAITHISRYWQE